RDAAERQHDLWLDDGELVGQERRTRSELIGFGIAIAGWPTQHRVRDKDVALSRQVHGGQHLREQLTRAADERQPLRVFVGAPALAAPDAPPPRRSCAEAHLATHTA